MTFPVFVKILIGYPFLSSVVVALSVSFLSVFVNEFVFKHDKHIRITRMFVRPANRISEKTARNN